MHKLEITYRSPAELSANPANARTHSREQIRKLAKSIESFQFNDPILIDDDGQVISGHCRLEAAKLLGLAEVPTVRLSHLNPQQKRAYVIAANRLAELAGWSEEMLALELGELSELDLGFDLDATGFDIAEIDLRIGNFLDRSDEPDPDDYLDELPPARPVSQLGDLWLLGKHRLLCADAREFGSYERLLAGECAQAVISDVPYNLKIDGVVSGTGRHEEFLMASGEMSSAEFTRFLTTIFRNMSRWSTDGSLHYIFIDWRHLLELLRAGNIVYSDYKNLIVWDKGSGGMGSHYRSQHELIAVFKNGRAPSINNVQLGRFGRSRTNVWSYPGMNSFGEERDELLRAHPTCKPVKLIADAILDCSAPNGVILDPFLGSGTTILAAERTGRRCAAMELEPKYVDVALRRYRKMTGEDPVHQQTGMLLSQLEHADHELEAS